MLSNLIMLTKDNHNHGNFAPIKWFRKQRLLLGNNAKNRQIPDTRKNIYSKNVYNFKKENLHP